MEAVSLVRSWTLLARLCGEVLTQGVAPQHLRPGQWALHR